MKKWVCFLSIAVIVFISNCLYATQVSFDDNITGQVLVASTAVTGSFDLSSLFDQNIVIDSVIVSFAFQDDGDATLTNVIKTPHYSAKSYNGNYYELFSTYEYNSVQIYSYTRYERSYYQDERDVVSISMNTLSASAYTNYFSTTGNFGSRIYEGNEDLSSETLTYYNYYYHSLASNYEGYRGAASAQISFNPATIDYLMEHQGIDFTLTASDGMDMLFNSATMDIEYHIEASPVPEPQSILLFLSSMTLLAKKFRK